MADPRPSFSCSQCSRVGERVGTKRKRTPDEEGRHHKWEEGQRYLELDERERYLNLVRDAFGSSCDPRYCAFVKVIEAYREGRIDNMDIISCAKVIFQEHHELLMGLNILLPKGYNIHFVTLEEDETMSESWFDELNTLAKKVEMRFQDAQQFMFFIRVVQECVEKFTSKASKEVYLILQDHPDLVVDFCKLILRSGLMNDT